jgi:hypothetical protein
MFKKILQLGCFSLVILLGFACTNEQQAAKDPKQKLSDYITKSFSVKSLEDRNELLGFLTGEAKARLASWSDDQFREAFVDSKRQFSKFAVKEVKNFSPAQTEITYELAYNDKDKSGSDTKITNKKMAEMVKENGSWYIKDVHNIKELVEFKNEMSLP